MLKYANVLSSKCTLKYIATWLFSPLLLNKTTQAYSQSCQTCKMEGFAKIVDVFQSLNCATKFTILRKTAQRSAQVLFLCVLFSLYK